MFTLQYDDQFIEKIAAKIADRATEMLVERIGSFNDLPLVLTREEAMKVLRCGPTKMAELMARPDFPVSREFGVKIPTHMLTKWIEKNTRWMEANTGYFNKAI
ncbi:hypothetical protein [Bacillus sp. 1NLA3E]|uniref:hypothetical protein n=1 Tax=Bacillus sp. 1NLA3E TaxID=666686 RepID=UPI000247EDED|nr:hypothetical protein [Bacillus sp. 1NLA3E]AGK52000.1 hypothetical protein B1NLA3E_01080 [Bacillus sp. 1NLA3E]